MNDADKKNQSIKRAPETIKKEISAEDVIKKLNSDQRFDKTIKGKDSTLRKWIRKVFNR